MATMDATLRRDDTNDVDFIALTTKKLNHSIPSIRQRALESLHFKIKFNLLPTLSSVTSNEELLETLLNALDSERVEVDDGSNERMSSPVVAVLLTLVRKSTKQELVAFQRTMRKIRGDAVLRRIAADCKLTVGKEWMSDEIDTYFKAKRRAMVMQVGNDYVAEEEGEAPLAPTESFNAKEEEIRRRLKRYEIERTRTNHFKFCARAVGEYVLKCRRDGSIRIIILSRVINGDTSTSDAGYERSRENAR